MKISPLSGCFHKIFVKIHFKTPNTHLIFRKWLIFVWDTRVAHVSFRVSLNHQLLALAVKSLCPKLIPWDHVAKHQHPKISSTCRASFAPICLSPSPKENYPFFASPQTQTIDVMVFDKVQDGPDTDLGKYRLVIGDLIRNQPKKVACRVMLRNPESGKWERPKPPTTVRLVLTAVGPPFLTGLQDLISEVGTVTSSASAHSGDVVKDADDFEYISSDESDADVDGDAEPRRRAHRVQGFGGTVHLNSQPSGATVLRDGVIVGTTPMMWTKGTAGQNYNLEYRLPGSVPLSFAMIYPPAGEILQYTRSFQPDEPLPPDTASMQEKISQRELHTLRSALNRMFDNARVNQRNRNRMLDDVQRKADSPEHEFRLLLELYEAVAMLQMTARSPRPPKARARPPPVATASIGTGSFMLGETHAVPTQTVAPQPWPQPQPHHPAAYIPDPMAAAHSPAAPQDVPFVPRPVMSAPRPYASLPEAAASRIPGSREVPSHASSSLASSVAWPPFQPMQTPLQRNDEHEASPRPFGPRISGSSLYQQSMAETDDMRSSQGMQTPVPAPGALEVELELAVAPVQEDQLTFGNLALHQTLQQKGRYTQQAAQQRLELQLLEDLTTSSSSELTPDSGGPAELPTKPRGPQGGEEASQCSGCTNATCCKGPHLPEIEVRRTRVQQQERHVYRQQRAWSPLPGHRPSIPSPGGSITTPRGAQTMPTAVSPIYSMAMSHVSGTPSSHVPPTYPVVDFSATPMWQPPAVLPPAMHVSEIQTTMSYPTGLQTPPRHPSPITTQSHLAPTTLYAQASPSFMQASPSYPTIDIGTPQRLTEGGLGSPSQVNDAMGSPSRWDGSGSYPSVTVDIPRVSDVFGSPARAMESPPSVIRSPPSVMRFSSPPVERMSIVRPATMQMPQQEMTYYYQPHLSGGLSYGHYQVCCVALCCVMPVVCSLRRGGVVWLRWYVVWSLGCGVRDVVWCSVLKGL